jgi:phytanoyl-CoA hydroxylase
MVSSFVDSESIAQFKADGFVAFPAFVAGDDLSELIDNVDRFVSQVVPQLASEFVFYDNKNVRASLKQIQQMGDHDPYFDQLFKKDRFRGVAEALIGGPVIPKNMQYFDKPPQTSKPTPPHQDGYYFMLNPCSAVTMWLALDHVDEENGCVRYVRGSHSQVIREHRRTQTLGFSQGIVNYPTEHDAEYEVAIPAEPGDLLVHHAMTIHRADQNRSVQRSRRSLGFIYYDQRAKHDAAAHAEYQRRLAVEMKAADKI